MKSLFSVLHLFIHNKLESFLNARYVHQKILFKIWRKQTEKKNFCWIPAETYKSAQYSKLKRLFKSIFDEKISWFRLMSTIFSEITHSDVCICFHLTVYRLWITLQLILRAKSFLLLFLFEIFWLTVYNPLHWDCSSCKYRHCTYVLVETLK